MPDSPEYPRFDSLPQSAQERISGIAERYQISRQHAVGVVMLLTKGASDQQVANLCQDSGIALKVAAIKAIRQEMEGWVSVSAQRRKVEAALEKHGLLTEERKVQLATATTAAAIGAVYFDAFPLSAAAASDPNAESQGWWHLADVIDPWTIGELLNLSDVAASAWDTVWSSAAGVAEGTGDLLSNAWDQVDLSSVFDGIDF